ncbi:hypothetical protein GCM10027174_20960 [Salinifilum aidingensis]
MIGGVVCDPRHMSAIVTALAVGAIALGLVASIVVFAVLALAGLKAVNAAHEGRTWFVDHIRHRGAS